MINWTKHWLEQSTSSHAGDLKKAWSAEEKKSIHRQVES